MVGKVLVEDLEVQTEAGLQLVPPVACQPRRGDDEDPFGLAPRHHLTIYHEKAEKMGKPLEAAMLIGAPSTSFLTAAAPLPYDVDELEVAARLRGAPIPMRKCRHIDLEVPAETEIVIEGRFLPNVRRPEGPFGEFMGYYVPEGPNAVFEVLGVTVRKDAVFHSILCGSAEEVLTLELSVSARFVDMNLRALDLGLSAARKQHGTYV